MMLIGKSTQYFHLGQEISLYRYQAPTDMFKISAIINCAGKTIVFNIASEIFFIFLLFP